MPRWRFHLVPARDESFFEHLVRQASNIEEAAQTLSDLISEYEDVPAKAAASRSSSTKVTRSPT